MRTYLSLFLLTLFLSGGRHTSRGLENDLATWKKSEWLTQTFQTFASLKYSRIRAVSYWHEKFKDKSGNTIDLRINSSESALKAYQEGVRDLVFSTKPDFLYSQGVARLVPSANGIYLSAFPDFGGSEDQVTAEKIMEFKQLSQHNITWAYFSNNWYKEIRFPRAAVETIHSTGHVPFIRMMMRSDTDLLPDPNYSLQMIIDGKFDADLRLWAREATSMQYPLLVEFGPEPNGDWFPWAGVWNGGGEKTLDPKLPDGPTRFKLAYRHIIDIFRQEHVNNITWFFHTNAGSKPVADWNQPKYYYPGDDYIDWVGLSVYGPQRGKVEEYEAFHSIMDYAYPDIVNVSGSKPIAILEWGITENGHSSEP